MIASLPARHCRSATWHHPSPSRAITPRSERGDRVHGGAIVRRRPSEPRKQSARRAGASVAALGEDQPSADRASGGCSSGKAAVTSTGRSAAEFVPNRQRSEPPRCRLRRLVRARRSRKQSSHRMAGSAANQPSRPQRRRPLPSRDRDSDGDGAYRLLGSLTAASQLTSVMLAETRRTSKRLSGTRRRGPASGRVSQRLVSTYRSCTA